MKKHKNIILNYFNFFYTLFNLYNCLRYINFNYLNPIILKHFIILYSYIRKILSNLNFSPNFRLYILRLLEKLLSNQYLEKVVLFLLILKFHFNKFVLFQN